MFRASTYLDYKPLNYSTFPQPKLSLYLFAGAILPRRCVAVSDLDYCFHLWAKEHLCTLTLVVLAEHIHRLRLSLCQSNRANLFR